MMSFFILMKNCFHGNYPIATYRKMVSGEKYFSLYQTFKIDYTFLSFSEMALLSVVCSQGCNV